MREPNEVGGDVAGSTIMLTSRLPDAEYEIASCSRGRQRLLAVHIVSGDRWAGAEVQLFTLLKQLHGQMDLHVVIMNPGELATRCQTLGIPVSLLDENRLSAFQLLKQIRRILATLQPDIVHTHRQKENVIGSLANLFSCRARCVRTVHGAPEFLPNLRQRLQGLADVWCGQHLQHSIIAVSTELEKKLIRYFPRERIQVIHNGIDPAEVREDASPPMRFSDSDQVHHVGLVGRVEAVKRPDLFLKMAALLTAHDNGKAWHFHVFGEGGQLIAAKHMARELNIDARVSFHGHRHDIRRAIAGLHAVVICSDHEGLPMTALETLALGVRLVAHDTGGLSELLATERHFLVSDHSAEGYAVAVRAALDRPPPGELAPAYLASSNAESVISLYRNLSRCLASD